MATVLSTTEAELIGFQSQLCRVSHQSAPRAPLALPSITFPPLLFSSPTLESRQSSINECARNALRSNPRDLTGRSCRFRSVIFGRDHGLCWRRFQRGWIQGPARFEGLCTRRKGATEQPFGCSRIIKGSPNRTDGMINKPGAMNESQSRWSAVSGSRKYSNTRKNSRNVLWTRLLYKTFWKF